jgi:chromosome segregation protein
MQLTRLKITGFKSFADAVDIHIERGLTGVVGPNGCGKSNLVEALRWVMGESSYKNMRASHMDDVIFAGTTRRASRNHAEVMLTLDNTARTAPAPLNEADVLEVSRKIVSGDGSTYRINGREVRARDVQVMFADAATGARSSALVRQGQIAEIIAAKPQARRAILEDAAGIGGLYTRRREAEHRLKAADENLIRVEDVLREIEGQAARLSRQAVQAAHYRTLSADIRHHEMLLLALAWMKVQDHVKGCEQEVQSATLALAQVTSLQAQTAKDQAIAAHSLEPLRQEEHAKAQALQNMRTALQMLEGEERRSQEKAKELERRLVQSVHDEERQKAIIHDAQSMLTRVHDELSSLSFTPETLSAQRLPLEEACARTAQEREQGEEALTLLQAQAADRQAQHHALTRAVEAEQQRIVQTQAELTKIQAQKEALTSQIVSEDKKERTRTAHQYALQRHQEALENAQIQRHMLATLRDDEQAARTPLLEAEKSVQRLEGELNTLQKLFAPQKSVTQKQKPIARVLDSITVQKGFEVALSAALGDDLEASLQDHTPIHWAPIDWANLETQHTDSPLPEGALPLSEVTQAPPALTRALHHIGVVSRNEGEMLHPRLKAGQSLVTREGDVWRWDGLVSKAQTSSQTLSHATRVLVEKNRLSEVEDQLKQAHTALHVLQEAFAVMVQNVKEAANTERLAIESVRDAQTHLDQTRQTLERQERDALEITSRLAMWQESAARLEASLALMKSALLQTQAEKDQYILSPELTDQLTQLRLFVAEKRVSATEARASLHAFLNAQNENLQRQKILNKDVMDWEKRLLLAQSTYAEWQLRLQALKAEQEALAQAPDTFLITRRTLLSDLQEAEVARQHAADCLAHAQQTLNHSDKAARDALDALAKAREQKLSSDMRLEAALTKRHETLALIADHDDLTPASLLAQTKAHLEKHTPTTSALENNLSRLKKEREALGGVNLRADDELKEIEDKKNTLLFERDDLTEAIKRLRTAVGSLNREGRERLLAAFDTVNNHFKSLFTLLFGGGAAELKLIESDDPLEAGLEIIANPPGKKPQILTLLSGGEQALTATALIFAVFLTNPSPVCVLDEVDAPLDDANVERYCDLLEDMVKRTDTRFLVITHNPITMSRMNRLFGVTMAEQGVSMVVSVDLEQAQELVQVV